jgi:hypothetical protein
VPAADRAVAPIDSVQPRGARSRQPNLHGPQANPEAPGNRPLGLPLADRSHHRATASFPTPRGFFTIVPSRAPERFSGNLARTVTTDY